MLHQNAMNRPAMKRPTPAAAMCSIIGSALLNQRTNLQLLQTRLAMFVYFQLLLVAMLIITASSSVLVCGCCKKKHQRRRITRNRPPSNASEIDSNSKKPDDRHLAEPRTAMKSTIDTNPEAVVQGPRSMPPDEKVKQTKAENNVSSKIKHPFSSTSARKKKRPADDERSIVAVQKEPVAQPNAASLGNIDGIMKAKPKGYLANALSGQHAFDDIHQKEKIRRPKPGEEAKLGKEGNYMFAMSADASRTASLSAASLQEAVDMTPPISTPEEDQQKLQQPQQTQQQQSEQQLSTEMPKENVEEAAFVSSKTL